MLNQNEQAVDIKGYRVLSDAEKAAMNELKGLEAALLEKLDAVSKIDGVNQRSLALGRTNVQQGFMWAIRAVARPNGE